MKFQGFVLPGQQVHYIKIKREKYRTSGVCPYEPLALHLELLWAPPKEPWHHWVIVFCTQIRYGQYNVCLRAAGTHDYPFEAANKIIQGTTLR